MKGITKIILAVAGLALAALACQAITGGGNPTAAPNVPPNTEVPTAISSPVDPGNSDVLFKDDFSPSRDTWGTGADANSSIEYDNEALRVKVFSKNYFVWTAPNEENYENVHLEVTANTNGSDPATAFGIVCDQQVTGDAYYFLVITPAGDYAIAKAAVAQAEVFLTNNDKWASSDSITKNASSYRIGADCANGSLTLYVDGKEIASVSDSTYTSGGIGLITWSGENSVLTDVTYDDFVATALK